MAIDLPICGELWACERFFLVWRRAPP